MNHLKYLKETMKGEKLRRMKESDMRERRKYTKLSLEVSRMAFRLETYQFDCRVNMPTKYGRDLICRACCPLAGEGADTGDEKEQHDESQEHLEECQGYAELWQGLGPYTLESRCRIFMRVKAKRLLQQEKKRKEQQQQQQQEQ